MTGVSKETVAFTRDAANVFFHILTRCNLRCRHCYINPEAHGTETLPLHTIDRWLRVLSEKSRKANVVFLGGEPTLHPELPEAVRAARRLGFSSITVDTNGYLFHDFLQRVTPEEVDVVSFSLDGPCAETNDPIRGTGSYRQCLKGIQGAVRRGFSTSMIYTVSRENLSGLERMPSLLASLGVHRFFIQVIGIRGQPAGGGKANLQVSRRQWTETVPRIAEDIAGRGIVVSYPKVFLEPGEPFACAGLVADNYFVFPNGRVYRCPLCEDHPLHSLKMENDRLVPTPGITEADLFSLQIPEGCVMNRLIQPGNIRYGPDGKPDDRIACCLLKEQLG